MKENENKFKLIDGINCINIDLSSHQEETDQSKTKLLKSVNYISSFGSINLLNLDVTGPMNSIELEGMIVGCDADKVYTKGSGDFEFQNIHMMYMDEKQITQSAEEIRSLKFFHHATNPSMYAIIFCDKFNPTSYNLKSLKQTLGHDKIIFCEKSLVENPIIAKNIFISCIYHHIKTPTDSLVVVRSNNTDPLNFHSGALISTKLKEQLFTYKLCQNTKPRVKRVPKPVDSIIFNYMVMKTDESIDKENKAMMLELKLTKKRKETDCTEEDKPKRIKTSKDEDHSIVEFNNSANNIDKEHIRKLHSHYYASHAASTKASDNFSDNFAVNFGNNYIDKVTKPRSMEASDKFKEIVTENMKVEIDKIIMFDFNDGVNEGIQVTIQQPEKSDAYYTKAEVDELLKDTGYSFEQIKNEQQVQSNSIRL